jgi:hypothetical protein
MASYLVKHRDNFTLLISYSFLCTIYATKDTYTSVNSILLKLLLHEISGVRFPAGNWNFSLLHRVQTGTGGGGTQTSIQWVTGTLSQWVKKPGPEADHSPPSSADVKNSWRYTSTPIHLHYYYFLIKYSSFIFFFFFFK